MPYIAQNDRDNIDLIFADYISDVVGGQRLIFLRDLFEHLFACDEPPKPGELNYIITTLIHQFIKRKGLCYATLNEAIGVLECAKLELYRRIAAPYEDKKVRQNGCVSEFELKAGINELDG